MYIPSPPIFSLLHTHTHAHTHTHTQLTIMNAGRKYLGTDTLAGKVFVTSGLGGMSGAQAKASIIAGCVGVIAEVNVT